MTRNRKFQKKSKKFKKLKKIPLWLNFKPKQVEKDPEREKINVIVSFRSYKTRNRKLQKNSKNYKIPLWLHLKQKQVGKG